MSSNLDKLFAQINKSFGENTIKFGGSPDIKTTPSGSLTLDLAIGRGGIPRGRLIECFGPESSGKTTIALLHAAEVQREGEGLVAFIDAEHAFDPVLAASYGVDLSKLAYIDPKTAENAIDTAEALIRSGEFRLVIIDSVSALTPTKIVESSIEQQTMGMLARFMSTTCQKLNGIAYQNDCTVFFINQIREKIGGYAPNGVVPTTTSGGRALPFYSSVRLNVRRGENITEKDDTIGHYVKVKVVKNKVGTPFKEAMFPLYYSVGVDRVYEIVELAVLAGVIQQGGAWFKYADESGDAITRDGVQYKWQGKAKVTDFVKENPAFLIELEEILRGVQVEAPTGEAESEDGYSGAVVEEVTP
jgi:recombination protein RecA